MSIRAVVQMSLEDADHYTPEERAAIAAAYPEHEREARVRGVPTMGSGRVFPVAEERIVCAPFAIPKHWLQINGLDFGWDHPFAAVNLAWDRDADCVYVCKDFAVQTLYELMHADAERATVILSDCKRVNVGIELGPLSRPVGSNLVFADNPAALRSFGPVDVVCHERERGIDVTLVECGVRLFNHGL